MARSKVTARKGTPTTQVIMGDEPPKGYVKMSNGKIRKKPRNHPGTVALREIRKQQRSSDTIIPKLSFERVVREIIQDTVPSVDIRLQRSALSAIQEAAEAYVVDLFESAVEVHAHCGRTTLQSSDLRLVRYLRKEIDLSPLRPARVSPLDRSSEE